ncbi:MAG TPA: AtpZ/AtpI family protein [Bacillales bacterium]|nr:AtpZ/AtpI family protein [Bacillales bacterium]
MNNNDTWRMIGLVGTFGLEIAICTIGGLFLGRYLDSSFDTKPVWLLVGTFGGLVVGILSALYTLKTFIKE